ncbi:copper resistance CopC family protein [Microbacterium sp. gxy059]|uniref:copper resistance CopC family protein n=1 Tax=Microbacterium sp. gxy059 TaxID=2957199 RepID=UPI003D981184
MSFTRSTLAGGAVALLALVLSAAPAAAHDQLIDSSPAADERLDEAPASVEMMFSGDIMTIGEDQLGATVLVVDGSGRDWVEGAPQIDGGAVTVDLADDMPAAEYEVRWQVVSEDGHPIEGVIPFAVEGADPAGEVPTEESSAPSAEPEPEADAEDADDAGADAADAEEQGVPTGVIIGSGVAVLALIGVAVFFAMRRPRSADADEEDRA